MKLLLNQPQYTIIMSHIFISYSKKNHDYARKLADKLLELGFDVWIDDRIDYGDDWWREIVHAIRAAKAFIVIMTNESDASKWVQREVTLADQNDIPAFPVWLDGDFRESTNWAIYVRTQYADVRGGKLPDDGFYNRLAGCVPRKIAAGQNVTPSVVQTPKVIRSRVADILPPPFEWCEIPTRKVRLEAGGYVREGRQTFDVPAFAIAKYPVTNAQFAKFIEANGYTEKKWWTHAGRQAKTDWTQPEYWTSSIWNGANYPVVGVSWYEAMAFCRWLSAATGEAIMLPTEQEWQRAAQGDDGRVYPWGNKFDPKRCNTEESSIKRTTPVTQYPNGVSPYGVMDMIGNVWEWCLTGWDEGNSNIVNNNSRVVRGGAFDRSQLNSRAACRVDNVPDGRYGDVGFRVVVRPPSP